MAISIKSTGSYVNGTANLTPVIPTAAAGDMMLCFYGTKPYNDAPTINQSWTDLGNATDGTVAAGIDVGSMQVRVFYKIHTGTESDPTITNSTNNVSGAVIIVFQKASNEDWVTPVGTGGGDATAGTGFSVTGGSSINIKSGDFLAAYAAIRSDAGTQSSISLAATGATLAAFTESPASDLTTTSGGDMAMSGGYTNCTAGDVTVAPVYSSTLAASHTGAAYIVRLRVAAAVQTITLPSIDSAATPGTIAVVPEQIVTLPSIDSGAAPGTIVVAEDKTVTLPSIDSGADVGTIQLVQDQVITLPEIDSGASTGSIVVASDQIITLEPIDSLAEPGSLSVSISSGNPIVGYGTNSGGYSPSDCYGVVPTIPLYHHPSENAQPGMLLIGKKLYLDDAGTTPAGNAATYWSFNRDGNAADRAVSIASDGTILNFTFRNGVVFGYSEEGGNCGTTSFSTAVYNAPDDYQFWYPRKAVDKTAATIGGIFLQNTHALSYSSSGPAIGTAAFSQIESYQNSYTSLTPCSNRTKRSMIFIFQ